MPKLRYPTKPRTSENCSKIKGAKINTRKLNERIYRNKTKINLENIMEDLEQMDFLKNLLDSPETDPEFYRQFNITKKDLKRNTFIASIDKNIRGQLFDAKLARIIKRRPNSITITIKEMTQRMKKIIEEINHIEEIHKLKRGRMPEEQIKNLELIKEELNKEYNKLKDKKNYIYRLSKLTEKQIKKMENIK